MDMSQLPPGATQQFGATGPQQMPQVMPGPGGGGEMSPEMLRAILSSGGDIGQMTPQITSMQEMIKQLRERSEIPTEAVKSGRFLVKPSLLSVGAGALNGMNAMRKQGEVTGMQQQQESLRNEQVQRVLEQLLKQRSAVPNVPQSPGTSPTTSGEVQPLGGYSS